ncbi:MAG TPA: hypothetical protein VHG88_15105 [Burkholderiales bacterium]|nr:hypothetical protein [Burkholderiales bacterium]
MKAAILALLTVLALLAPHAASAHGGHEPAVVPPEVQFAVSPLCPPGSGHVCACGDLSLCDARTKAIVSAVPGPMPLLAPAFRAPESASFAPPHPAPWHSPASPRAPPLFS